MHKGWARNVEQMDDTGQVGAYAPPRSDLNAPDLYIPLMSFVTYIIIIGFLSGLNTANSDTTTYNYARNSRFSPEILGITASKGSVVIGLEVLFIKLGNYFMNISVQVPFMDLISYTGYQFIPICIVLMIKFAFGLWIKFFVYLYCFSAFGFFTVMAD
jgi:protein transport protein YIF1